MYAVFMKTGQKYFSRESPTTAKIQLYIWIVQCFYDTVSPLILQSSLHIPSGYKNTILIQWDDTL